LCEGSQAVSYQPLVRSKAPLGRAGLFLSLISVNSGKGRARVFSELTQLR
jgi:hypothetical protein